MNKRKNQSIKYYSLFFLVVAGFAGVFFYYEVMDAWEIIKTEQGDAIELDQMHRKDISIGVIDVSRLVSEPSKYAVIDVREKEEFNEGRIKGALNYRLGDIIHEPEIRQAIIQKTAGKERIFYCHEGSRSRIAAQIMQQEFGAKNYIMVKGYKQFKNSKESRQLWQGSFNVLPKGNHYKRTPFLKKREVNVKTLVDLSANRHEYIKGLEGKTFLHVPILLMSTRQINQVLATLGTEPVVALCNSKVSCFSTRILRYRLKERNLSLSGFVRVKNDAYKPSEHQ